jgi:DNA polymerase-3 subunit epsilon/ATP-dependent DNA helicase DinG
MCPIVAIDIETTGLDPQSDAIIEISAVRFNGKRVDEEWSTLINPGRPIPPMITQLTGITNEMVRNQPQIREKVNELAGFVGNDPVLGQNVMFDLSFLRKFGILFTNPIIDTYELASVLMPTASRYNLGSLGQLLGILIPNSHRATDDARLTHAVYLHLYEKALALPIDLLAEFVRQGENLDWNGNWFFQQLLKARVREPVQAKKVSSQNIGGLFSNAKKIFPPLSPVKEPIPLNVDEAAAMIEEGGPFADYYENFEQRSEQIAMLRSVAEALSTGQHLLVEAGTGTGKSYAYLIPAAMWASTNGLRVVVSTNTINLQDQLITKDLPDLCAALNLNLNYTLLKGRSNYLCPRRLDILRQRKPETVEAMRVLSKVLVWLHEGGKGDRNEINLNGPIEREVWASRLSAEDEGCKAEVCMERTGGACPFYQARQAAQSAHIIIVNHALLLTDIVTNSRVLPEYEYLIVDEAHHLEDATTGALSYRATESEILRLLREYGGPTSGIVGALMENLGHTLRPSDLASTNQAAHRLADLAFRLEQDFRNFFMAVDSFLKEIREDHEVGIYGQQVRILPSTRTLPVWSEVEIAWDSTQDSLSIFNSLSNQFHKNTVDMLDSTQDENLQDLLGALLSMNQRFTQVESALTGFVADPNENMIYWAEIMPPAFRPALNVAPLHIGKMMEEYLWHEKSSVILTSATLAANNDFSYLRGRLNADEADELVLGSPFDYENSALLYLVNDIPEPADATNYQRAVERILTRLAKAIQGRTLALFTSYAQLKRTSQAITPTLLQSGIQVYEQGEGASANALLESFREADKAILLGTRAFWEGVDIPGQALSAVAIVKLPFDVPSDPIIAARSETFDDPFNEYSLPEAILRFRQGFGRLIRTQTDRGVVAILDRRILTKRYGRLFIESLPNCKIKQGPGEELPGMAAKWLNLEA